MNLLPRYEPLHVEYDAPWSQPEPCRYWSATVDANWLPKEMMLYWDTEAYWILPIWGWRP